LPIQKTTYEYIVEKLTQ